MVFDCESMFLGTLSAEIIYRLSRSYVPPDRICHLREFPSQITVNLILCFTFFFRFRRSIGLLGCLVDILSIELLGSVATWEWTVWLGIIRGKFPNPSLPFLLLAQIKISMSPCCPCSVKRVSSCLLLHLWRNSEVPDSPGYSS